MVDSRPGPERVSAFSDAFFAVIITIMVLELKAPAEPQFSALLPLWPTATSYTLSFWFTAVVWVNHHHLLHHAHAATPRLIWVNFAHLFAVSLVPFTTSWMADTNLAGPAVSSYAAVFWLVNLTYFWLIVEILSRNTTRDVSTSERRRMHIRSLCTLAIFGLSMLLAPMFPIVGLVLCCSCLFFYLRPEAPAPWLLKPSA
ncbi:MAG TPA: TMEM175 family protein [Nitrospira sp.]|nr:TMEM175 family protein [Nitrospira sp.]